MIADNSIEVNFDVLKPEDLNSLLFNFGNILSMLCQQNLFLPYVLFTVTIMATS